MKRFRIDLISGWSGELMWLLMILQSYIVEQKLHRLAVMLLLGRLAQRCWPDIKKRSALKTRSIDPHLQNGPIRELLQGADTSYEDLCR